MRNALGLLLVLVVAHTVSLSGDAIPPERFKASTIPPSLLADVHAVVRYELVELKVSSIRRARERVHTLITVLDAEGRNNGEWELYYDKFDRLIDVDATLYDASGEEIRSLEKNDVKDYAAPGSSLYADSRARIVTLYHSSYPYTIEMEYEYEFDGYESWPVWFARWSRVSVEFSSLSVIAPKDIPVRYWSNLDTQPAVTESGGTKHYLWTSTLQPPHINEPVGPSEFDQRPRVRLAPARFEIDGFEGDLSSWKSLGQWYKSLYQGRQLLPDRELAEVQTLVKDAATPEEKVRRIYNHLQSTTRYISVQLGVGGWQPFDAAYVCSRGYGDCKALSNYTVAMLNAVGVKAYPALINNGLPPLLIDPEFTYRFSNHVIACVPLANDTIWLECTSQIMPMGKISASNENRYVLVVGPDGGVLVRTPKSKAAENTQTRSVSVTMSLSGSAAAKVRTSYSGNQMLSVHHSLFEASPKEREEWLRDRIEIPAFNLQSMDFSRLDAKQESYGFDIAIHVPRFAATAGTRMLFQPNLMEKRTYVPPADTARKHPIIEPYAYIDIDTILYKLPEGYAVEALPSPVVIDAPFARYSSSVLSVAPDAIRYTRRLEVSETEIPAKSFNEYRKFFQQVVQADKASAALVKK